VSPPFKPKGAIPEWRMIYERLLEPADFGDVITYDQLEEALGRRFEPNRSPIYRARQELGEMRHRWLESVPRVGYRVIEASEHMRVAQGHKRKARTQLGIMVKVGEVTDISRLTPEQLAQFDTQTKVNWLLYSALVHHEKRIARIEEVLRGEGKID
jgi:hypothetical protein